MTDPTRDRIAEAFDRALAAAPVPPYLRAQTVRAAVHKPQREAGHPQLVALVAAVLAVAVIASLVIGAHMLRANPTPARNSAPPPPYLGASVVYDQDRGQMVMFAGNETWTWDGKSWSRLQPKVSPSARTNAAIADDMSHHVVLLFGGITTPAGVRQQNVQLNDTWAWDGHTWKQQLPQHSPSFTYTTWPAAMGFDPVTRRVVLLGFTFDYKPQTWDWDGTDWTQLSQAASPDSETTMFSDGRHLYAISAPFAGVQGRYVSQMWRWDGASWQPLDPSNNTFAPALQSAAFDLQRNQLVVMAGDTWTWDGSHWMREHPQSQPSGPYPYLVYMSNLHEVVSWGDRFGNPANDMWAWNGSTWKLLQAGTVTPPTPSSSGKGSQLGPMSPATAETMIRQSVTTTSPVLLPSWLPEGMEATLIASADGFNVQYVSDQRDKRITLGVLVPNPPPGGPNSKESRVSFRSAGAQYFVYDSSAPYSNRWLMWYEPGKMAEYQTKQQGVVPYFLSAEGLTDQEFWQVANSLK